MSDSDTLEGRIFSRRYLLGPELGEGGMGTVYRATDLRTGGIVAVKVVRPSLVSDRNYITRLQREAQYAAAVESPRVVRIIDLNTEDDITYFVMEYVDGKTLSERLRGGPLTVRQALYIAREIAWALDAINARGIIHRDLKPQNIKVDAGGAVKLLDFGIARAEGVPGVTSVGLFVGSPIYAAPERIDGQNDIRGDVYAVGAILFEMLTGAPPFSGMTPMTVLHKHATEPLPPLPATLPQKTRTVVETCLAKRPEQRYQTPRALAEALSAAIADVGGTAEARRMVAPPPEPLRAAYPPPPGVPSSSFVDETLPAPGQPAWPQRQAPVQGLPASAGSDLRRWVILAAIAVGVLLVVLLVLVAVVAAEPSPARRGFSFPGGWERESGGSTQASPSFTLLGHTDLGGRGFAANVRAHQGYAYVGTWGAGLRCPSLGVRVVDLSDPTNPQVVATAARFEGSSAEHVVPVQVSTPFFSGDLLAVGIQRCTPQSPARGGLALVDISDPRNPVDLGFFDTAPATVGVHELDIAVQGDRVLALLAVPGSENVGLGDFRVVDITDPRNPVQRSTWGVRSRLGITEGVGCSRSLLDHSARAGAGGTRAYLSYWDAGVIILDISDPASPQVVGRIVDENVEGAVHSVDEMAGGLLLVAEEVNSGPSPFGLRMRAEGGGTALDIAGCETPGRTRLDGTGRLSGQLADLGTACAPNGVAGAVALAELGSCSLAQKTRVARESGARALVVIEDGSSPVITINDTNEDLAVPVIGVGRDDGLKLRGLATAPPVSVVLPSSRPWGGLRIWDISDPARPVRRAVFRTEDAERFPPPGPGWFTAHNPLSVGRLALVSWYSDGVRLLDLTDLDRPREVASFVPPAAPDPNGTLPNAPLVWGVDLSGDLVLASDMNGGLYVLRLDLTP